MKCDPTADISCVTDNDEPVTFPSAPQCRLSDWSVKTVSEPMESIAVTFNMLWICSASFKTKLKLLITIAFIIATSAQQVLQIDKRCKGVYFSDKYHDIEILKEGLNKIHEIILNRNDNTLYFILEDISVQPIGILGYLNINTREAGLIHGIRNASSIAIDQEYNRVYIGGQEGIYRINNKKADRLPVYDDIQSMYFKDVLFYTNSRNEAYMYDNGHINPVFELQFVRPEKIILDDDHNIFFTEGKNLFRVRLGTRVVNSHERYRTNVLTTDADGKPFISTKDGVYTYNKYKYVFDKVSEMTGLKALTFNKDNEAIYAVLDFIIKLKYNPNRCFEQVV